MIQNTDITRITHNTINDVIVSAYPQILFEAVDLVKDICVKTQADYSVLLAVMGLGGNVDKETLKNAETSMVKLATKFATFLFSEYDKVNRTPGPYFIKLINILSDATDIKKEVLEKTDYRILLKILTKFVQEPEQEMAKSFLEESPST